MVEWSQISFEHAYVLGFIAIFVLCHWYCPIRVRAFYFAHIDVFSSSKQLNTTLQTFLKFTAITTLFIALASPYTSKHLDITPKQGYDIALMLDGSYSMRAGGFSTQNYTLNRFDVVKDIVQDFVDKRKNDNLGVVMFGEYAFVAAPLTYDKKILKDIVGRLEIGMAGKNTAIYDALGQGISLLRKSKAKSKVAILLTDGRNTALNVTLDAVLSLAKKYEVKVYTIGIGERFEIDEPLLVTIAQSTGGEMFIATDSNDLEAIYEKIDLLEKSEIKSKHFEQKKYYYQYPLAVSIVSLIAYLLYRRMKGLL